MIKLTQAQKEGIQRWLDKEKSRCVLFCPFENCSSNEDECMTICPVLFPRILKSRGTDIGEWCPCFVYTLGHVVRVARRILKEHS
jgi:hypothetical protein